MTEPRNKPEIDLLCELVRCASITPDDAGCQAILMRRLEALGFECETLIFGDVTNLWARRGSASPVLCFAGHTDVVPPGDVSAWSSHPFEPTFKDDCIYGRGTADMKSGLAAIVIAIEQFLRDNGEHKGSLALLITSDEEGRARDGTLKVMETLTARGEKIDWCVIGEPSSEKKVGDLVRIGRRGSLSAVVTVNGIQGHVAYPQLAVNPIRKFAPVLAELHTIEWDQGNEYFPPTSFQVVEIQSGIGAPNVTPATLSARFNFRYSTEWSHESLKKRVHELFDAHDIDYELRWHLSGEPFLTRPGKLIDGVVASVVEHTGFAPELSTGGGTSDGRFISPAGVDVVELGPVNASIHKLDEHIRVADLVQLTSMYRRIMELML
jgi:succinyl-diaminopimelate desuccinylase